VGQDDRRNLCDTRERFTLGCRRLKQSLATNFSPASLITISAIRATVRSNTMVGKIQIGRIIFGNQCRATTGHMGISIHKHSVRARSFGRRLTEALSLPPAVCSPRARSRNCCAARVIDVTLATVAANYRSAVATRSGSRRGFSPLGCQLCSCQKICRAVDEPLKILRSALMTLATLLG
jgi:hypothetical protein